MIQFTVEGPPVPMPRPRFGQGRVYNTPKSKAAKEEIQLMAQMVMRNRELITGPIRMDTEFFLPISKTNRAKNVEGDWHIYKPDRDNLIKLLKDALKGIVWLDDSQVCTGDIDKKWTFGKGKTVVRITPI